MARQFTPTWPPKIQRKCFIVSNARYYENGGSPTRTEPYLISPGSVMHATKKSAEVEAERLAQAHPGERFIVWSAVTSFEVEQNPVRRETL